MSLLILWGFVIYLSNLYSIISNQIHNQVIKSEQTYKNYLIESKEGEYLDDNYEDSRIKMDSEEKYYEKEAQLK